MRKIVIEIEVDSIASINDLKADLSREIFCCSNYFDVENMRIYETNENPRILKKAQNFKVTYDIDYLLDHLSREVYLLESFRRWKENLGEDSKNEDDRGGV